MTGKVCEEDTEYIAVIDKRLLCNKICKIISNADSPLLSTLNPRLLSYSRNFLTSVLLLSKSRLTISFKCIVTFKLLNVLLK